MQFRNYFEGRPHGKQATLYAVSLLVIIILLSTILTISFAWVELWYSLLFGKRIDWDRLCVQLPALEPPSGFKDASEFLSESYRAKSADLLGGAVKIPTESFDDMNADPKKEERFKVFHRLNRFLEDQFPLSARHLEYVNTYGMFYTLKGSRPELEPVVLMAHQDVVPVDRSTLDQWTHGAFSGYFDGDYVWGRGSLDTKSSLVAILEATEKLLAQSWQPERTVLICFGFDEELDGSRGALSLADTIRNRYGSNESVHLIIDEGSSVITQHGHTFAFVSVSEKGYTDIDIVVKTPGGHSSAPPDHTGIGIISELITELEADHIANTKYRLKPTDIVAETYSCIAKYAENTSAKKRSQLIDLDYLRSSLKSDRYGRPFISTTQAIDIINGGVKINALPEEVSAVVNYRIDVHESVQEVTSKVVELAKKIAEKYDLGVKVNGRSLYEGTSFGTVEIRNGQSIEPAPISPFDENNEHWRLLAGTTKHTLDKWFGIPDVTVAPVLMTGNTDTWRYHGLTKNIYRYTVGTPDSGGNAHTVDEYISIDSHLAAVVWYYEMLQFF